MIKTEPYGGGVRWYCTNCDTDKTVPGSTIKHIYWTNGKPPKVCSRCNPHQEYRITLDLQALLPYENASRVREALTRNMERIQVAVSDILKGRDVLVTKLTASRRK